MTESNTSGSQTLVELLRRRAERESDRIAYRFLADGETEVTRWTYGELDRRARAIAAYLQAAGAEGKRTLLFHPPGLDFLAAFFGCLYARAVAVPAYFPAMSRPDSRIDSIAEDCGAEFALMTEVQLPKFQRAAARFDRLRAGQAVGTDSLSHDLASRWREPSLGPETLAFLQYSSGSTGHPKGVMVSHGAILRNVEMIQVAMEQDERSTMVSWLPLYHDMGLIGNALLPFFGGFPSVLMAPAAFLQKPLRWLEAITRYRATITGAPNFAFDLCVERVTAEQKAALDLSSLTVIYNGAEPVRASTCERFSREFASCGLKPDALYPCFGLAEATLFVTGGSARQPPAILSVDSAGLDAGRVAPPRPGTPEHRRLVSCGRGWLGLEIVIADPDSRTRAPEGSIGEIWVSSPAVTQGYWNRAEETEETFRVRLADTGQGPYLRTGDLGFVQDEELFVTGRRKDLIIIRGRNHYPQDIEWTVERSHSAVRASCVAAFSVEEDGEERLGVAAELSRRDRRKDLTLVAEAIRSAVAKEHGLAVHALSLLPQGRIPKTSSGKIRRRACRSNFLAGEPEAFLRIVGNKEFRHDSFEGGQELVGARAGASGNEEETYVGDLSRRTFSGGLGDRTLAAARARPADETLGGGNRAQPSDGLLRPRFDGGAHTRGGARGLSRSADRGDGAVGLPHDRESLPIPRERNGSGGDRHGRREVSRRKRVLFFAEAVTLAHVARPLSLARCLDPRDHDVVLACDPRFERLSPHLPFPVRPITSIPTDRFLRSLDRGSPVYNVDILRSYVHEDLEVIRETEPDVVVGDFRLSLSVSARLAGVPYMAITDACWSPYGRQRYRLAEHPMVRLLGATAAQGVFSIIRPFALAYHCVPLNQLRKEFGLSPLGYDLRHVYTDADEVLYADIPEVAPLLGLPENHHYLGPVLWSPAVPRPEWWDSLSRERPVIYVTFGTSGHSETLLPRTLNALADLPVSVVAASAGRIAGGRSPSNSFVADFLDGEKAAARSSLVICNGGTLTVQQALCARVPVLGIASNMNQHLNMRTVQRTGAGELLRAGTATQDTIRSTVMKMLTQPSYVQAAAALAEIYSRYDSAALFENLIAASPARTGASVVSITRGFGKKKKPIVRELEPGVRETAAEAEAYDEFDRLYGEILYQGFAESALRMGVAHGRVLDVGVGSSRIAIRLARLNPRFAFDVLALSSTMRELADRCVTEEGFESQIRVSLWDDSKLPFPDASFDMVISNNLLHRVADPSVVLNEIHRVARPEGAILVRDVRRLPSFWMELLLRLYCHRYKPTLKRLAEGAFRAGLSWDELLEVASSSGLPRVRLKKHFITSIGLEVPALSYESSPIRFPPAKSLWLRFAKSFYLSRPPSKRAVGDVAGRRRSG